MAAAVLELGLSNLVVAAALAVLALAAGWWGKRPALTHALWLLVLLKMVTPPVIDLPVRLLPAAPVARPWVPAAAGQQRGTATPPPPANPVSPPGPVYPPAVDTGGARQALPPVFATRTVTELNTPPELVVVAMPGNTAATTSATKSAPPAGVSLLPLGPAAKPGPSLTPVIDEGRLPPSPAPEETAAGAPSSAPFPLAEVVLAAWAGGAVVWLGLVAWRVRWFARVLRLADDAPSWFVREIAETAETLGLGSVPRVRLIPGAVAPMVWSLGRTAVYFPADLLARLSPQQRAALVTHELAHLKRGDHRVRWLELAVLALYWWCPLAWLARRELHRAEEECCDAWVVAALPAGGHTYATALLDTLDFLAGAPPAPALASGMGAGAAVKRRLDLILDGRTPKRLPAAGRMLVVLAALVLLPVAPKLARLAGATLIPEAEPAGQPADQPGPAAPKAAPAPGAASNPRGEPLLYETSPTDVCPGAVNWWSVAVSPDGKSVATAQGDGSSKGEVRVWDRETGKVVRTVGESKGVRAVAFSPDGKILVTGNYDGVVRFYDAATLALRAVTDETGGGHKAGVNGLCFFKDGKYLATAGLDSTVRIWDVAAAVAAAKPGGALPIPPVAVFEGHLAAAVSPAGEFLAVSGEGKAVFVLDRRVGKLVAELTGHADVVAGLAFSPDGKTLAPASYDKTMKLWDAATWTERRTLAGHTGWVPGVAFSPDGKLLATGSYDKTVWLWDAATGGPKGTWKFGRRPPPGPYEDRLSPPDGPGRGDAALSRSVP